MSKEHCWHDMEYVNFEEPRKRFFNCCFCDARTSGSFTLKIDDTHGAFADAYILKIFTYEEPTRIDCIERE